METIDVIHRSGVGISPERTIRQAADLMDRAGLETLAVIDGDQLVGVVTNRDLVSRALTRGLPLDSRVDRVMSSRAITIEADSDVTEAFEMFRAHRVRSLIVVRQGKVQGVISIDDLLVLAGSELGDRYRPVAAEGAVRS